MSPGQRTLACVAAAVLAGAIAYTFCNTLSECFYAVIPAIALVHWLTGAASVREAWQRYLRPAAIVAAGLFAVCVCLAHLFLGWNAIADRHVWMEVASCLYFLAAVAIVLLTVRRSILTSARALQNRWQWRPGLRRILCEGNALVAFLLFAAPYTIAFSQVHRFKMPNLVDPKLIRDRDYQEIEFASTDGTRLRGWWIPARHPTPDSPPVGRGETCPRTLIICHGLAGNRSIFLPFVEVGDWLDANVLMLDMRGCGDSAGRTITFGYREKEDILAALKWARRERSEEAREVIGLGISMGAAALAQAAPLADPPFDAIILDTPFASTREMTASAVGGFPRVCHPWLLTLGLPLADWHAGCPITQVSPESDIDGLRTPVLFFHCRGDWLIPSEHSVRMYERPAGPKQLCIFELPGHADAFFFERDRYRREVLELWSNARAAPRER